jgi:glycosyltransferase involved in cell wall biosynthesis
MSSENLSSIEHLDKIRCLWIGRDIPVPANTGERLYSLRLAESLAAAGASVTYFGQTNNEPDFPEFGLPAVPSFIFKAVSAQRRSYLRASFSHLPLVAATYSTVAARRELRECLRADWDAIILDNYAAVWALPILHQKDARTTRRVILVHVSHNCERDLALTLLLTYRGSLARKIFLGLNYLKISFWEKKLVSRSDVLSTITHEDLVTLTTVPKEGRQNLVLTPGYEGPRRVMPTLDLTTDRRVVLVGSFKWIVKQQNLCALINAADESFHSKGISLDVVGEVPEELRQSFSGRLLATHFHGFVDDFHPLFLRARMAIVPEVVGGGFKLKILDYIFGGLPVATLSQAAAGLPESIKSSFIQADSLDDLVRAVIDNIDNYAYLKKIQASAFASAANEFNWSDRGRALLHAIKKAAD